MKIKSTFWGLLLGAAASSAACADTLDFEGVIKFTSKTASCPSSALVGAIMHSRFHPTTAMASVNHNWLGINRDAAMSSEAWGNWGAASTTAYSRVNYGIVLDHFAGRTDDLDPSGSLASIKFDAIPTGLTTSTKFVQISGQIKNPFGNAAQASCVVGFTGAYMNRKYLAP